ncbi:MAG: MoxR family ATPase [Lachnospiraceae bacterium]|jgi:MoxR-like ATPase|nr:MoxR family ATPase [Lachnospiraceae bacterium]
MINEGESFLVRMQDNIGKVMIGKEQTQKLLLSALLAEGHVLFEDVPGTGKTMLAKTLAKSMGAQFARIQFTPDLLPGDLTGINLYDRSKNEFVLRKGPVFTNFLLADELNRATPRTQAGLLECMEERQVTIDGTSYILANPFFVVATQNPIETAGTFPLPEAQLDRFLMRLSMGLPTPEEEKAILARHFDQEPLVTLSSVLSLDELSKAKAQVRQVFVHDCIRQYIVEIVNATRKTDKVTLGVSPRGSLALQRAAKAYAWLSGRLYVIPDDIKALAVPVLSHRLILGYGYGQSEDSQTVVKAILEQVPVPLEDVSV